jgi:uncharacterized protein
MHRKIEPRPVEFPFSPAIDKHWFGGSAFKTHWLNSYTLIIPEGEKFILRSTKHYLQRVDNDLKDRVLGLTAQEALHSREHERFYHNLRIQGYKVDAYVDVYRFLSFTVMEKVGGLLFGPSVLLSTSAAIEHINAVIAEIGLTDKFLVGADRQVRPLFEWHYAEEIEHKAVCHDVLQQVAPSYLLRVAGLFLASATFVNFLFLGTGMLLVQDKQLFSGKSLRDAARFLFKTPGFAFRYWAAVREYLRPSFHPDDRNDYDLAAKIFAHHGRPDPFEVPER